MAALSATLPLPEVTGGVFHALNSTLDPGPRFDRLIHDGFAFHFYAPTPALVAVIHVGMCILLMKYSKTKQNFD